MKFNLIQPIFFGKLVQENNNTITVIFEFKKIIFKNISDIERERLLRLIILCDGMTSVKNIVLKLSFSGYDKKKTIVILRQLLKQKILIDSRELYLNFHPFFNNVTPFYHQLTKGEIKKITNKNDALKYTGPIIKLQPPSNSFFLKLIQERRTKRQFERDKTISFQTLSELFYVAYGISEKTKIDKEITSKRVIPSAGALFPLNIYCITLKKVGQLSPGLYYFDKGKIKPTIVKIKKIDLLEILQLLPGSEYMARDAAVLMIIVCNFKKIAQKYSNRGYLYGLLEAGHAAQNIYLYCTEKKIAATEIGGFRDTELSNFLGLDYPKTAPVLCFLIGKPLKAPS